VVCNFCGVFSKSASVPCSVSSSRQRTIRLDGDLFFTGVKDTPFRPTPAFLLRGDDFIGDIKVSCSAAGTLENAGAATGFVLRRAVFFRFGVPLFEGENTSTGAIEPSGLITCPAAV
jgi:hypothetical protein